MTAVRLIARTLICTVAGAMPWALATVISIYGFDQWETKWNRNENLILALSALAAVAGSAGIGVLMAHGLFARLGGAASRRVTGFAAIGIGALSPAFAALAVALQVPGEGLIVKALAGTALLAALASFVALPALSRLCSAGDQVRK